MNIVIKTIPNDDERYATPGDWWFDENQDLQIRVSDMGNWKYEALVATHELQEALLCKERGINEQEITEFDIEFEKHRQEGDGNEPGDSEFSPYRDEHFFATNIERMTALELGVDWEDYDEATLDMITNYKGHK